MHPPATMLCSKASYASHQLDTPALERAANEHAITRHLANLNFQGSKGLASSGQVFSFE